MILDLRIYGKVFWLFIRIFLNNTKIKFKSWSIRVFLHVSKFIDLSWQTHNKVKCRKSWLENSSSKRRKFRWENGNHQHDRWVSPLYVLIKRQFSSFIFYLLWSKIVINIKVTQNLNDETSGFTMWAIMFRKA